MKQIQENYFNNLDPEKIIVVDFFAEWCNPCKMLMPFIEEICEKYKDNDKVEIVKANVEDIPEITAKYSIMSVPTVLFFRGGEVADFVLGFSSKEAIEGKINNLL